MIPFPVQRWVRPNFHYKIKAYDTFLPQNDPNKAQRELELDHKRTMYKYCGKKSGLPGQIAKLPKDEAFDTDYLLVNMNAWFVSECPENNYGNLNYF